MALLRHDLSSFIHKCFTTVDPASIYLPNWHIEAIAWQLQQCLEGSVKRLIVTLPPRNLKSICISVAFPAWALGRDPSLRIISVSYSNELTSKHARDCRSVMESDWYRQLFPGTRLDPAKNTELEFATTRRGFRLGTSVGGTLTGRGGNLIIIDDPMKPQEAMSVSRRESVKQWYDGTLYSRLDSKAEGIIVLIMQRLHVDDLVAHVLEKEDWVHLDVPAIAETDHCYELGPNRFRMRRAGELLHPEREPAATLAAIQKTLGSYAYSAQYQQCPMPAGGGLIKWAWFRSYNRLPDKGQNDRVVQSWDTASKASELSDYSVGTTWLIQDDDYYLIEVVRERLEYPFLKKRVITESKRHGAQTILIEDKGSGTSLIQDLRHSSIRPIAIKPEADKVTRMSAETAAIEAGSVLLPERAPWLDDFQSEVLQFPHGRHDDQIDSLSQFLCWVARRNQGQIRKLRLKGF